MLRAQPRHDRRPSIRLSDLSIKREPREIREAAYRPIRSIARDAIPAAVAVAVAVVIALAVTVVTRVVVGVTLKICGSEKRTAEHRLRAERSG